MPLANSGDPWRAQISNTNATVVSNVVSFKFIIDFLFFYFHSSILHKFPFLLWFFLSMCIRVILQLSSLFLYLMHFHSFYSALFYGLLYTARIFKTFLVIFILDGIFICLQGDSEIYPLKLYRFYFWWKCISCVNQYHINISFTSKNRYIQRRICFDQFFDYEEKDSKRAQLEFVVLFLIHTVY